MICLISTSVSLPASQNRRRWPLRYGICSVLCGSRKNGYFFAGRFTAVFALSITRSTACLILPVVWSSRPSSFKGWSSVKAPTASFTRPLILSLVPLITLSSSWLGHCSASDQVYQIHLRCSFGHDKVGGNATVSAHVHVGNTVEYSITALRSL